MNMFNTCHWLSIWGDAPRRAAEGVISGLGPGVAHDTCAMTHVQGAKERFDQPKGVIHGRRRDTGEGTINTGRLDNGQLIPV